MSRDSNTDKQSKTQNKNKCKKGRHCLILKTKSLNEDIISMNIYITNNTAFLFVKQNLRDDRRHRQSKTNRRL